MKDFSTSLGSYQSAVDQALNDMGTNKVVARLWEHDHTLWKSLPDEITNRLGWLTITGEMRDNLDRITALTNSVQPVGYRQVLLLGMGGSSLAPEVFGRIFGDTGSAGLDLDVLDSTDPATVLSYAERLDPAHTLFVVSTKSGSTVETLSFFKFLYTWVADILGAERAGEHFVAITDPGSRLVDIAEQYNFLTTFLNDPNIGGRYSALSYFGLVPAGLVGVDLDRLLDSADAVASACGADNATTHNPGARLGAILGELAKAGRDKATFVVSPEIASFGDWVEQLIAESTGKEGTGILPVVEEPVASPNVYGDDRLFIDVRRAGDDTDRQAIQALEDAGHPIVRIEVEDRYDMGGLFFLWEFATAVAGERLGINPFDQPNVESAKKRAKERLNNFKESGELPALDVEPLSADSLRQFLQQAEEGDYIALQAFIHPTPETDAALNRLRTALRDRTGLATTVGYGPRFLHSTGQLHKGDAGNGLFIQFTSQMQQDAPIPDSAGDWESSVSFGVLKMAQAMGDRQALLDAGRRVLSFYLSDNTADDIEDLAANL